MIDILIVEDDQTKVQKIVTALCSIDGISQEKIEHVIDSQSAKIKIRKKLYDLLILDIAIPLRLDQQVDDNGGTSLLKEIVERDVYNIPQHIIGLTQYKDIFEKIKGEFEKDLIFLLLYDPTSDDALDKIRSRVSLIICSKIKAYSAPKEYCSHLSIICATYRPELESVLNNGWDWEEVNLSNDDTIYYQTKLEDKNRIRIIYAASSPKMGLTNAAILSTKMSIRFKPKYIAMCGISAGYRDSTKIGDIIIADPSWDWGSGKYIKKENRSIFQQEPHQIPLDTGIRKKLLKLADDEKSLFEIRKSYPGEKPEHNLSIHIGPLASGASVLADGEMSQQIKDQNRKILGVEMESYAIYATALEVMHPKPIAFSLKSIVDFADTIKNDKFQKYASFVSAKILKLFVEKYL